MQSDNNALIKSWLKTYSISSHHTRDVFIRQLQRWFQGENKDKRKYFGSLEEAVAYQKKMLKRGGAEACKLGEILADHVREIGGTRKSMPVRYITLKNFFQYHFARIEERKKPKFEPSKDSTISRLNLDIFLILYNAADLKVKTIYLTLLQGLMGLREFVIFNKEHGFELAQHIRENGVKEPFKINFQGRKKNENPFNTWIGGDALEAWKTFFERVRGWPREGEPAIIGQRKEALSESGIRQSHMRLLRKFGYVKGRGDKASRYGLNLHELRDIARSVLQKAKSEGLDEDSAEYWMGHSIDPNRYKKIHKLEPDYNLAQYKIAEKYLNVISGRKGGVEELIRSKEDLVKLAKALEDYGFNVVRKK